MCEYFAYRMLLYLHCEISQGIVTLVKHWRVGPGPGSPWMTLVVIGLGSSSFCQLCSFSLRAIVDL